MSATIGSEDGWSLSVAPPLHAVTAVVAVTVARTAMNVIRLMEGGPR